MRGESVASLASASVSSRRIQPGDSTNDSDSKPSVGLVDLVTMLLDLQVSSG